MKNLIKHLTAIVLPVLCAINLKNLKKHVSAFILPLLFGFFPLFFLYAQNAEEMVIRDIFIPLLLVTGFAITATTLLGFILKSFIKSAFITALLLFSYFSYGHVLRILPVIQLTLGTLVIGTRHFLFLLWIAVLSPVIILIIKTKRDFTQLLHILTAIGGFLILIQVVQAGFVLATRKKVHISENVSSSINAKVKYLPDIYYIIMDGYGGSEILREMYGFDNSSFLAFLKEKGFYVPDESFSHYCQTILSLCAILNMNYIDILGDFDVTSKDRIPVSQKLQNNEVVKLLKTAGYSIVGFESGYYHTNLAEVDAFIEPSGSMSEFENVLLTTTMFPFTQTEENSLFTKHRKKVLYTLDKIPKITEVESPKFVYAHIVSPHPPFIFDENGHPVQYTKFFHMADGSSYTGRNEEIIKSYRKGYSGQITFITELIKIMINKIFERYPGEKPVILLMADHGPGSGLDWKSLENTNIRERFSILQAYYLPGHEGKNTYENISPINMFRVIFNIYLGTRFKVLPNKIYYTTWSRPYDFHEITGQLVVGK